MRSFDLNVMIIFFELDTFLPVSVTLTSFQDHHGIKMKVPDVGASCVLL